MIVDTTSASPVPTTPAAIDTILNVSESVVADPPPPYPQRNRRHRQSRRPHGHIQTSHTQQTSTESQSDLDTPISPYTCEDEEGGSVEEGTPFLAPSRQAQRTTHGHGRQRSFSMASTASAAPSLAHTMLSLFHTEDDLSGQGEVHLSDDEQGSMLSSQRPPTGFFSAAAWRRYFRPMGRKVYYKAFLHLCLINFPYALAAWVYLATLTVSGTTLLMALPIGAFLCFINLLGARAFARGELYLQTKFHTGLPHPPPFTSYPLFTRYREPTPEELENGTAHFYQTTRGGLVREKSFYKNSYSMFTDSRSYQALFYFLVVKPVITLVITICILAFGIPLFVLVFPAPAILRALRRIGLWQANVAVEGLYYAVR